MGKAAEDVLDEPPKKKSAREILKEKINADLPPMTEEQKKKNRAGDVAPFVTGYRG